MRSPQNVLQIVALMALVIPSISSSSRSEIAYENVEIKYVTHGNFLLKTMKELSSKEGIAALQAVCAYFGGSCNAAVGFLATYHYLRKQEGEQYWHNIISPEGWEICKADYTGGVSGESTFSMNYGHYSPNAEPDGLSLYMVVPDRGESHWVHTNIRIMYVTPNDRQNYDCLPRLPDPARTNIMLYACKGYGPDERIVKEYGNPLQECK